MIQWVVDHREVIGGMSFLPADDANYVQAPNIEITQEQYEALAGVIPNIDFSLLYEYEKEDFTTAGQELACFAGQCEVPWAVKPTENALLASLTTEEMSQGQQSTL